MPRKRQASTLAHSLRCPKCRGSRLAGLRGSPGRRRVIELPDDQRIVLFRLSCQDCGFDRIAAFSGIVTSLTADLLEEAVGV